MAQLFDIIHVLDLFSPFQYFNVLMLVAVDRRITNNEIKHVFRICTFGLCKGNLYSEFSIILCFPSKAYVDIWIVKLL